MPTLTRDNPKAAKGKSKKTARAPKKTGKQKAFKKAPPVVDDDVIIPGEVTPETEEVASLPEPVVNLAEPFSDGIVSARLNNITIIPRIGNQETDVLKGFLRYFAVSGLFIGNVSSRLSFMKKKGGLLL